MTTLMTAAEQKKEQREDAARRRKLKAFQKRCAHPPGRHWQNEHGWKCHMRRDFKNARTWHCDHCFAMLPFGESLNPYVEQLAFDFLLGKFEHVTGGFPTTAFHDGYRNYDERMESWQQSAVYYADQRRMSEMEDHHDDYAAGAFARHLEEESWGR